MAAAASDTSTSPIFTVTKVIPRGQWSHDILKPTSNVSCCICQRKVFEAQSNLSGKISVHYTEKCGAAMHVECLQKYLTRSVSGATRADSCPVCKEALVNNLEVNAWKM